MNKDFIIALNLKNNLINVNEYLTKLNKSEFKTILFPSFLQLNEVFNINTDKIMIGCQNVQMNNKTLTGEVLAKQLTNYNVKYCIVGHSERRYLLNETNEQIKDKINELLNENITPVLCVGETEVKSLNLTIDFIKNQLDYIVKNTNIQNDIIVAYEPVFAIGTGKACEGKHIEEILTFLHDNYNFKKLLYGGSVNENNCKNLVKIKNLDGFLIGSASLKYEKINCIYENLK